jgi:hypothetical protein
MRFQEDVWLPLIADLMSHWFAKGVERRTRERWSAPSLIRISLSNRLMSHLKRSGRMVPVDDIDARELPPAAPSDLELYRAHLARGIELLREEVLPLVMAAKRVAGLESAEAFEARVLANAPPPDPVKIERRKDTQGKAQRRVMADISNAIATPRWDEGESTLLSKTLKFLRKRRSARGGGAL